MTYKFIEDTAIFIKQEREKQGFPTGGALARKMMKDNKGTENTTDFNTLRQRVQYVETRDNYKLVTLLDVLDALGYTIEIVPKNAER